MVDAKEFLLFFLTTYTSSCNNNSSLQNRLLLPQGTITNLAFFVRLFVWIAAGANKEV